MQIKIIAKNEKPLLSRTEIEAELEFSAATPRRAELKKQLAEGLKVSPDLVVIRKTVQAFGNREAKLYANIYKTKEDVDKYESQVFLKRGESKKKEGEAAPQEAPKEAPKKEEAPKEAPKKEEKKEAPKEAPKKDEKK
ncbi:MAG: 30S ribosomal protein S24e [bacterium]|nr:30S ribosomal protein S24e [bacterium]